MERQILEWTFEGESYAISKHPEGGITKLEKYYKVSLEPLFKNIIS